MTTAAVKITRGTAWMDLLQGASGLVLVLFMWVHMFLVSSILLGKDAMYIVTRMLEGEYIFGKAYPALVSGVAIGVLAIFLLHALVAMWKIPGSYREYRVFWQHGRRLNHGDTWLWLVQVATGLVLMFTATIHLYEMIMHPGAIGPHASSARVVAGGMWLLDLVLMFAVEVHAGVGIYRLILKWDLFGLTRRRVALRKLVIGIVVFYLLLGVATFSAYVKIGLEPGVGNARYIPSWERGH
ncbi:MAG: fumarate reductase cytochrome b subunit [Pseudomonadota bacterium]